MTDTVSVDHAPGTSYGRYIRTVAHITKFLRARGMDVNERQVNYMLNTGQIAGRKSGRIWITTDEAIDRAFSV
jgi:hypothetical protein